ncbi:MAG: peptidoglycan endopeptidase [Chlamydiae bacterium]|nr:peptidoglycan endopeptidase [Chlamydiota bacterium]
MPFVKVLFPTPILNTENFEDVFGGLDGSTLALDMKGHLRALEFTALPGMIFKVEKKCQNFILQVSCLFYPGTLYIDSRFTNPCNEEMDFLKHGFLEIKEKEILSKIEQMIGLDYCWGSNYSQGIDQMLFLYAPQKKLDDSMLKKWTMSGIDCSGILYEATNGYTPRNTSKLVFFGQGVTIENKSPEEIVDLLRPLDLIVWKGHVIVVQNKTFVIESVEEKGVVKTSCLKKLKEIFSQRKGVNEWNDQDFKKFVIRRWINA